MASVPRERPHVRWVAVRERRHRHLENRIIPIKDNSPHRTRWATYDKAAKAELLSSHCGAVFEDWVRGVHPGARRYWDGTVEFGMVREEQRRGGGQRLVVSEIKWRAAPAESQRLLAQLTARFERSSLAKRHRDVRFEIIDASELPRLAQLQR